MFDGIEIDATEMYEALDRLLKLASENVTGNIADKVLSRLGQSLVQIEKSELNSRRYTGNLEDAVTYRIEQDELIVGPNAAGGGADPMKVWAVWKGAKPRWIPSGVLQGWMEARGIDPKLEFVIRRSIAGESPKQAWEGGTSKYRLDNFGSKDWPFAENTLYGGEGQQAIAETITHIGEEVIFWIEGNV